MERKGVSHTREDRTKMKERGGEIVHVGKV